MKINLTHRTSHFALAVVLLSTLNSQLSTFAQGTAFTYQGRLNDGANLASGNYDLTFAIFGVASGGTAVAGPLTNSSIGVSNGLFTVLLDFGAGVFNGNSRWLEIGVRPAGGGAFTTLTPRQPITPAPYAIFAANAGVGGGSPWLLNGSNTFYNAGNVGIGGSTPSKRLEINTPVVGDGVNLLGNSPAYYLSDAGNTHRSAFAYAQFAGFFSSDALAGDSVLRTESGRLLLQNGIFSSGLALSNNNVGIGTPTPQSKLEVRGDIRLGPSGQFRAASGEENLRIVRGIVDTGGGAIAGAGWNLIRTSPGIYELTFTTPFSGVPAVTATVEEVFNLPGQLVEVHSPSPSTVRFTVFDTVSEHFRDDRFHFIAVGPR